MKGIVVEIHNHTAAVLSEDGCVVKMRNNNYKIGQEVVCMKKEIKLNKKVIAIASTAASFLIIMGGSAYAYFTPYSHVTLDVNPSIEYSLNRFDKVLNATGVNDDGADIINEVDLKNLENKDIEDAVSLTIDEISDAGYFDSEEGGIVITTTSDDMSKADELAEALEETANTGLENNNHEGVVTAEAVGLERVNEAKELGVTPGKLNIVEKLMESAGDSQTIDKKEWLNKSVKDIMAQTKKFREQNKEKELTTGEETQTQVPDENQEANSETEIIDTTDTPSDTSSTEVASQPEKQKKKKSEKVSSDAGTISNTDADTNSDSDTSDAVSDDSNVSIASTSDNSNSSTTVSNANSNSGSDNGKSSSAGSNENANVNSNSGSDNGNSNSGNNNSGSNNSDKDSNSSSNNGKSNSSNANSDKGSDSRSDNGKSNSGKKSN